MAEIITNTIKMDKLVIEGGHRLQGSLKISGAKNGSLALMPACILAPGVYSLKNTPNLRDVWTFARLFDSLGIFCELNGNDLFIDSTTVTSFEAPYEFVKQMRASFYLLGPLVARYGQATVSLPGGCAWGPRPVDLHIQGLHALGANIGFDKGYVIAESKRLHGARFDFPISSVGATGNVLMAATLAKGSTLLTNCAIEPEITSLARMLIKMGAKIDGIGTTTLEIEGVEELKPVDFETIPDRIEAATFLIAGAMTKGKVELCNVNPYHLTSVIGRLEQSGCKIDVNGDNILLEMSDYPEPVDVTTAVYPGFPTDAQAQWTAYMSQAKGASKVVDNIYKDRFKHVPELIRLGANINVEDNVSFIKGGAQLTGANVMSSDLRGSASLILAALVARGRTEVSRIYHIDRGYESIEKKLNSLGARIVRAKEELQLS